MQIGTVVISKAGRDHGRYYIVVDIINDHYVYLSDGKCRKIQNAKKKKIKHLIVTNLVAEEIKNSILRKDKLTDLMLQNFLQSVDGYKEG